LPNFETVEVFLKIIKKEEELLTIILQRPRRSMLLK
jgi:hypothetical protein